MKLESKMVEAYKCVYDMKVAKNTPMRIAAFMVAIDRVSNAYKLRVG